MSTSIFVSHASEDKDDFVRPLATALQAKGFNVWYDEYSLEMGDSLSEEIGRGLRDADFGIVVLSKSFFLKKWPKIELDSLVTMETNEKKKILPIWHNLNLEDVAKFSPILSGRLAVNSNEGFDSILNKIERALIKSEVLKNKNQPAFEYLDLLFQVEISGKELSHVMLDVIAEVMEINRGSIHESAFLVSEGIYISESTSYLKLKSGVGVRIEFDNLLLLAARRLAKEFSDRFFPISWSSVSSRYEYCSDDESLEEINIDVWFSRKLEYINMDGDLLRYLKCLVQTHFISLGYENIWGNKDSIGRKIIRYCLENNKVDMIYSALKHANVVKDEDIDLDEDNGLYFGMAIIKEMSVELMQKNPEIGMFLKSHHSPLNEPWKSAVGEKYGDILQVDPLSGDDFLKS